MTELEVLEAILAEMEVLNGTVDHLVARFEVIEPLLFVALLGGGAWFVLRVFRLNPWSRRGSST